MRLKFPPLCGGASIGLNDPGIETFEGNYAHYIVRECAQNSLDAASHKGSKIRLEFKAHSFQSSQLSFHEDLLEALKASKSYWSSQEKAQRFFDGALTKLNQTSVSFLRISDSGTTGVPGGDFDQNSPWYGLVKSRGVSVKEDSGSGGSFGIGKDAPLAGSACRTVLYSSKTLDGNIAFQGVSRLVTHLNPDETQGTGYIGDFEGSENVFPAIRDEQKIPEFFRRGDRGPGLDIWVVGFKYASHEWEKLFIGAALANFWPAVYFEKIEFEIGHTTISRETLPSLMKEWQHEDPVKSQFPFFQALISPAGREFSAHLPVAGSCKLFVLTGKDLPRLVAMTRKTGMIIYEASFRVLRTPFAGLFICESEVGNSLLKTLEPPSHDRWDPNRNVDDPKAKEALDQIKYFVRESLRTLGPDPSETSFNENILSRFLPDDEESELPDPNDDEGPEADLGGRPDEGTTTQRPKPPVSIIVNKDERGRAGSGEGEGGGGEESPDGREGDGKNTGGKRGSSGSDLGTGGNDATTPVKPNVSTRGWRSAEREWDYELVLRTDSDYEGGLLVMALDEDGTEQEVAVDRAENLETSTPIETVGNLMKEIKTSAGKPSRVRVKLASATKLTLRVKPS
ncbi:MAG: hypothetical protein P1U58_19940 [Verrucomicrobiales bacterium]|nr:hypothetical protein [Verrucomicrobiales bacterium]